MVFIDNDFCRYHLFNLIPLYAAPTLTPPLTSPTPRRSYHILILAAKGCLHTMAMCKESVELGLPPVPPQSTKRKARGPKVMYAHFTSYKVHESNCLSKFNVAKLMLSCCASLRAVAKLLKTLRRKLYDCPLTTNYKSAAPL